MKVGSIVECIDNSNLLAAFIRYGIIIPRLNTPYIVRELCTQSGRDAIKLEGLINPSGKHAKTGKWEEAGYVRSRFRELQMPDGLEEVLTRELQLV